MSPFLHTLCIFTAIILAYFSGFTVLLAVMIRNLPLGLIGAVTFVIALALLRSLYHH